MDPLKFLIGALIYLCLMPYSKGITTVSQNDKGTLKTYCVTNNESETLSWITPYNESFYNFNRDKTSDISKFISDDWLFEKSFYLYLGPVIDPRWQNFETFVSQNNRTVHKILDQYLKDYFELTFSIKYYEDAEMLIYYYKSLKQIISFKDNILTMSICPDKTSVHFCVEYINVTQNLKNYVYYNFQTWNHFTIRFNKDKNKLSLLLNNVVIQTNTVPYYGLSSIYMKSSIGAIWKLHIYNYYRMDDVTENIFLKDIQASNNKLCMSGYFHFDDELTIQIRQDTTIIKEDTFKNDNRRWKFIKIEEKVHGHTVKRYTFWIKHGKFSTVNFSHIKLNSDCDRDVNKIYTEFNVKKIEQVSCESLNNPNSNIRMGNRNINIDSACPVDEFGNDCIKCKSVFNTDICEETLTCAETNKCYCQPGYYGKHCKQKCDNLNNNVFGSNCNKNCGHCMDNKQCHHVTGHCTNGCEEYFLEPFCNETDLPYLKKAPVAQTPCYTTCNINFNPEMYEGRKMPDSYKVEIYENNGWKVVNEKHINDRDISLDKLNILTDYCLRIILCHNDECMEGKYVPILNFTTDCKDFVRNDVFENIESRKISFSYNTSDDVDRCTGDKYEVKILDETRNNRRVYNTNPNSKYLIEFWRDHKLIFNYYVTTDQEKPEKVRKVHTKSNIKSIDLSWLPPDESVGKIVNYSITYRLQPTDDCEESLKYLSASQTVYVKTNNVEIINLRPHSTYVFELQAFNKYPGEVMSINRSTFSRNVPNQDSYEIYNISLTYNTMNIYLKKNCERIESDICFRLHLQCFDSWCRNFTKWFNFNQNILFIEDLKPFTNYTILIEMATTFYSENTVFMQPKYVTTKPSVPNELRNIDVYSISNTGISLVFDLPDPMTGILEEIHINSMRIIWEKCSIWKHRFCTRVNTRSCSKLQFKLKNVNVTDTKSFNIYESCEEKEPEPPQNLQQRWDDDFNLILSWEHPLHMNGEFDKFLISYADRNMNFVTQENLTYTHKMTDEEICSSTNKILTLKVFTKNRKFTSKSSNVNIKCPVAKPKLAAEPTITKRNNHSLEILIPKFVNPTKESYVHVVVTQMKNVKEENLCNPKSLNDSLKNGWIAFELTNITEQKSIVLGEDINKNDYSNYLKCYFTNRLLDNSALSDINIILTNIDDDSKQIRRYGYLIPANTTFTMTDSTGQNVHLIYLLLIPFVIILGIYIYKRKLINNIQRPGILLSMQPTTWGIMRQDTPEAEPKIQKNQEKKSEKSEKIPEIPKLNVEQNTKLLKISDFEQYVKSSIKNNELEKQYETMLNQLTNVECEYGKLPKNKPKNRYANIVAYDHSRVVLQKIKDDEFSDYINANYIHGLDTEHAYIAAQAPKENTLVDFWRMICEQNVTHIVMLTNVYEGVKKKSEKYWPDVGETTNYGSITVNHSSFEVFPDYEERLFVIKFNNHNRNVVHLHYTTWPDHGVPMYPSSVVPFVRKILKVSHKTSPILVHCSAGVGRTGTIILIDLCLRMVSQIGALDVFYHLKSLRKQRSKMVDTPQQYKFAHLVLLECLVSPDTAYPCDENFERLISNIDIPYQMEYIESSAWYEDIIMNNRSSLKQHDPEKDRFPDIIPYKYGLVYLSPVVNSQTSNYINAVSVDSFMLQSRFISTQQPMPNTLADFWRLAYEYDIRVIVSLQEIDLEDKTCCNFYPNENLEKLTSDNCSIELTKIDICERYKLIWLNMHFNKNQKQLVVIELEGWQFGQECPPNASTFLNIFSETYRLIANSKQILVTCKDGASGCGLFIALSFMLEKIKFEQICDVCHAVRTIRRSRKQFVRTEEQFRFLYNMADRYLKEFEIYSNFASK